jgi:hypothetical protein
MSLSLLKFYEKDLLSLQSFEETFTYLKKLPTLVTELDIERLIELCFDRFWLGQIKYSKLNEMRDEYFNQILRGRSETQLRQLKKQNRKAILIQDNGVTIPRTFVLDPQQTFTEKLTPELKNNLTDLGYVIADQKEEPYIPKAWRLVKFESFFIIENYEPQIKTLHLHQNNFST